MEAATTIRSLPAQRHARNFERDCERLRPLGEAFVMRRFSGALNRADAEDAVSDVIIRLYRRMLEGRAPDNLRAAFFTSVRNAAIDQLRSQASKPTVGLEAATAPSDIAIPLEHAEKREDAVRLQEALKRMRGNYREAIVLRFGLGMTVPEISRHLSISLPAAKKLVLRATQQVKKRLESIESAEFCPEMRQMAQRSLLEKEACGVASESEAEILRTHFQHCGSCKSFLSSLHDTLHDFGSSALLTTVFAHQLDGRIGALHHLARWASEAVHGVQVGGGKARLAAYKATAIFHSSDGSTAGLLTGGGQKIAAICSAGAATTATCLLTGVAGPGIGLSTPAHHHHAPVPPAKVRAAPSAAAAVEEPLAAPKPRPEPSLEPSPGPSPEPAPEPTDTAAPEPAAPTSEIAPAQTAPTPPASEFGLKGSAANEPAPSTSTSTPATSGSLGSSSGGGGGSSGSTGVGFSGSGASPASSGGGGGSIGFQK